MTRREAAIVMAYTGIRLGDFGDFHVYAEEKLGRPIRMHEFAVPHVVDAIREHARADFLALEVLG